MPAKGSIAKTQLMEWILKNLPDNMKGFSPDNKEIRVDIEENGQPVQIKISLTAVKSPITNNPDLQIVNEEQFFITEAEKEDLMNTLNELGVSF